MKAALNPYPDYHPAESAWLGQIPIGWKSIQLARLNTKLTNGFVGPTRDILREEGVRYLQSLHVKAGKIIFGSPYFVSEEWSAAHKKSVLKRRVSTTLRQSAKEFSEYSFLENPMRRVC
jgi:type I restriction enzyme S subunit